MVARTRTFARSALTLAAVAALLLWTAVAAAPASAALADSHECYYGDTSAPSGPEPVSGAVDAADLLALCAAAVAPDSVVMVTEVATGFAVWSASLAVCWDGPLVGWSDYAQELGYVEAAAACTEEPVTEPAVVVLSDEQFAQVSDALAVVIASCCVLVFVAFASLIGGWGQRG